MLKGILATVVAVSVLGGAVAVQTRWQQQMPGMMAPSMDQAQGMMTGGMMGQGMMGSGMMQMMGQGMGMMATGGPGAVAMLNMRDALDLTDEQVRRLEAIRDELSATVQPLMTAMMSSHAAAAEALQGDTPDFDAYQQGLQAAANIMVSAHVAMARAQVEARDVLTPEQLELLGDRGQSMMQGMMQMHGWPEMMGR